MTDDFDFIALYQELDCLPEQGVDALRNAWRRRVARLHPDRGGNGDASELQRLNAAYAMAMAFHARNGRLPGSAGSSAIPARTRAEPAAPVEARPLPAQAVSWRLLLPLIVLGVAWMAERSIHDELPTPQAADVRPERAVAPGRLRLGLHEEEVLALLGEPVSREVRLWQWGPSWVAFEGGRVVDWYSSRLRPLKGSSEAPSERERRQSPVRARPASGLPGGLP